MTTVHDYISIRKKIHDAGNEFYEHLGLASKNLQYIAGEMMSGNEEYIRRLYLEGNGLTIGAEEILKTGFTTNQKNFLERLLFELTSRGREDYRYTCNTCLQTTCTLVVSRQVLTPVCCPCGIKGWKELVTWRREK